MAAKSLIIGATLFLWQLCLPSCTKGGATDPGSGNGNGGTEPPVIEPPAAAPPPVAAPAPGPVPTRSHLTIWEPRVDVRLQRGATVRVVFETTAPSAAVTFLVDADSDLSSLGDQFDLPATAAIGVAGRFEVSLTLPQGLPFGAYTLFGRCEDSGQPLLARADGRILVDAAPTLQVHEPAAETTISRGGRLQLAFTAVGLVRPASVRLVADVDGDPSTVSDQHPLAVATSTSTPSVQTSIVDLAGLPLGRYRILGLAVDGVHPVVSATADGELVVVDVAFAVGEGGSSYEEGRSIATFPDGSSVATGRFSGSPLFGEWPQVAILNSAGDDDAFVTRYRADGTLGWARRIGGEGGDGGASIASFDDGSCVVAGHFRAQAFLTSGPPWTQLTSAGERDILLVRYDANGNLLWAKRAGGIFNDEASGVAALPDGSCVVTGSFMAQATFGENAHAITLLAAGMLLSTDVFVARYDRNGVLLWATRCGGADGNDSGHGITASGAACLLTGSFQGTATFGALPTQVSLTSAGGRDVFVACFGTDGSLRWANRAGGLGDDDARGIAMFPDGSSVVTGSASGTFGFGSGVNLNAVGARDVFLARYRADGMLSWAKQAGGLNDDEGLSVTATPDGRSFVTGCFQNFANFGEAASLTTLTAVGGRDAFVACYEADGACAWARSGGGMSQDKALGIASFDDGSFAVTGVYLGAGTFGAGIRSVTLQSTGWGDIFVVRYNADGDL